MTQQFKVGDRVKPTSVHVSWSRDKIGAIGIITGRPHDAPSEDYIRIRFDGEVNSRTILIERLVYASIFYNSEFNDENKRKEIL